MSDYQHNRSLSAANAPLSNAQTPLFRYSCTGLPDLMDSSAASDISTA